MIPSGQITNSYENLNTPIFSLYVELNSAIREDDIDRMIKCIEKGADVNGIDVMSITPLMWAAHYGRVNMMMWLCDHGANIDKVSWAGYTALTDAVVKGHVAAVTMLLNLGANRNVITTCDQSLTDLTRNQEILNILNNESK